MHRACGWFLAMHVIAHIMHFVHCVCFSNDGALLFGASYNSNQPCSITTEGNQAKIKPNTIYQRWTKQSPVAEGVEKCRHHPQQ